MYLLGSMAIFSKKIRNYISLHKHNSEFIICGDININYLESNNKENQLPVDNLSGTYDLIDTVFSHKNSKQFSHTN